MDSTIKKESDLPAADPNTPIPLKYEDRSEIGAAETGISSLLERGQDYEVSKNFSAHTLYNWTYSVLNFHVLFTWPSNTWTSSVGPLHMDQKHQTRSGMIPGSWQHRMKLQFFFKASKAYYVLSEAATNLLKYGRALRYIKLSLQCHGKDS